MLDNAPSRLPANDEGLFRGMHPENLPDFMSERLSDFFTQVSKDYHDRIEQGRTPGWYVEISVYKPVSATPCEYTEFQENHDGTPCFKPETYGFCDGKLSYEVEVKSTGTNRRSLGHIGYFGFLAEHEAEFTSQIEELASMVSYDICRGFRWLSI